MIRTTRASASWSTAVSRELSDAREALHENNPGRARACARRACGRAISAIESLDGCEPSQGSAVQRLRNLSVGPAVPEKVRLAAIRLTTNVRHHDSNFFTNDPIADATVIVDYVRALFSKRT